MKKDVRQIMSLKDKSSLYRRREPTDKFLVLMGTVILVACVVATVAVLASNPTAIVCFVCPLFLIGEGLLGAGLIARGIDVFTRKGRWKSQIDALDKADTFGKYDSDLSQFLVQNKDKLEHEINESLRSLKVNKEKYSANVVEREKQEFMNALNELEAIAKIFAVPQNQE